MNQQNFAGFFTRFIALLSDSIMISIIGWLVALASGGVLGLADKTQSNFIGLIAGGMALLLVVIFFLLQFRYFGYFWSKNGQSLGMKALNIKVVRQDDQPLSFLRAGLRGSVGYWISSFIFGLGYLWAAFDGNKEAWHDKLFGAWVVTA